MEMNMQFRHLLTRKRYTRIFLLATVLGLTACGGGGGSGGAASYCDVPLEASLTSADRIGGATTSTVLFTQTVSEEVDGEVVEVDQEWTLYNVANELRARPVSTNPDDPYYHVEVPGYIRDIEVVTYTTMDGLTSTRYALLAMGDEGIAVVNLADPTLMKLESSIGVNYEQTGLTWADGGGNIVPDNVIASNRAPISSLAVYDSDPGNDNNPLQLLIADEGYGLHKTLLSNLLEGPVLDVDGLTLLIDADNDLNTPDEVYTLQFAGEVPWGGPMSMTLYPENSQNQRLFVAMGYLGMGIFDPVTLEQVGTYNLYTDAGVTEDWFVGMDVSAVVQDSSIAECDVEIPEEDAGYLDADTGMPNFRQVCFEIREVWKGDFDCSSDPDTAEYDHCTPWAAFDRYGKDYYKARAVDVATFTPIGGGEATTIAYIAYGLGGLVAVDVTGYEKDTPREEYLGYAPAVPAKGPDLPTGTSADSLFPHFGSGMLQEAGAIAVKVSLDPGGSSGKVYYSDHFAGLVVLAHAEDPKQYWKDPSCFVGGKTGCNNNVLPEGENPDGVGDHWPDYEFVTSYDFGLLGEDEAPPAWMIDGEELPDLLVTGEVGGHGNALALMPPEVMDPEEPGQVDVLLAAGAGGMNFVDILNLDPTDDTDPAVTNSYDTPVSLATTDEVGADVDGLAYIGDQIAQPISIGHTEGVDAWRQYLFVADGPHGMSAWKIANGLCYPYATDDVHLVANTLQAEYPEENTETEDVYPTPHAYDVVLDIEKRSALVLSQSLGMRRLAVADVQEGLGEPGSPLLQQPAYTSDVILDDIFEHSVDAGNLFGIKRQDHAYDVVVRHDDMGDLAFVSDGSNGLTVYDLNVKPDYDPNSADFGSHVVSNLGAGTGNPLLGRATAAKLWTDPNTGTEYAFVAAGHAGIAVVDITDVMNMRLVKRFEPIKPGDDPEDPDKVGKADGRSVDVQIVGDYAYFSYDSFGIVAYRIDEPDATPETPEEPYDLISPLPEGTDPTKIWKPGSDQTRYDYRPVAASRFKLQDVNLGGWLELAGWGGGALGMYTHNANGKQLFYVAYGDAGVIKINWTDPANPVLEQHVNTVGAAADVTVVNGRAYVADNGGGIALIQ